MLTNDGEMLSDFEIQEHDYLTMLATGTVLRRSR